MSVCTLTIPSQSGVGSDLVSVWSGNGEMLYLCDQTQIVGDKYTSISAGEDADEGLIGPTPDVGKIMSLMGERGRI